MTDTPKAIIHVATFAKLQGQLDEARVRIIELESQLAKLHKYTARTDERIKYLAECCRND